MRLLEQLDRPVQMRPKLHRRRLPHVARDSDAVSQIGEARCQATAGAATVRQVRCRRIMRLRSHRVAAERAPSRIRQGQPGACMWTSMLVDEGAPTHIQMQTSPPVLVPWTILRYQTVTCQNVHRVNFHRVNLRRFPYFALGSLGI